MSPFEMDISWNPKSALPFITGYESSIKRVDYSKKNIQVILNDTHNSYGIANEKQSPESFQKI